MDAIATVLADREVPRSSWLVHETLAGASRFTSSATNQHAREREAHESGARSAPSSLELPDRLCRAGDGSDDGSVSDCCWCSRYGIRGSRKAERSRRRVDRSSRVRYGICLWRMSGIRTGLRGSFYTPPPPGVMVRCLSTQNTEHSTENSAQGGGQGCALESLLARRLFALNAHLT